MPRPITAVIVDDERLARMALRMLLADHPHVQIVGEAASVPEAVEVIQNTSPEVVFLDIQMPDGIGFDLLNRIDGTFKVVFVTAYDSFAIRAFEVNALDYVLKPVSPERLAQTLARLDTPPSDSGSEPDPGAAPDSSKFTYDDAVFLSSGQRQQFVKINHIQVIQAERDYSHVITTDGRRAFVRKSMTEWEERLPSRHFLRVHRSIIVNLDYVDRVERSPNSSYCVFLRGAEKPFPMGRRFLSVLREQIR
jgi:two-component system LytT family response regulator